MTETPKRDPSGRFLPPETAKAAVAPRIAGKPGAEKQERHTPEFIEKHYEKKDVRVNR